MLVAGLSGQALQRHPQRIRMVATGGHKARLKTAPVLGSMSAA
jgi:hypothetical protein